MDKSKDESKNRTRYNKMEQLWQDKKTSNLILEIKKNEARYSNLDINIKVQNKQ